MAQLDLPHKIIEGPVDLWVKFFMPIPKGTSKKDRESMNLGLIRHQKKPDVKNMLAFVEDALNKVIWEDDSQICRIEANKRYDDIPRTEIVIFH